MINWKRSAGLARNWIGVCQIVLLTGLVLLMSCSDSGVDPDPQPLTLMQAISYFDWNSGDLKYVEKTGVTWGTPEVVNYRGDVGRYSSLALDARGNPHIAYYDRTNEDLKYATRTIDGWQRYTVDSIGNMGSRCAIALDTEGVPYISYRDATNGRVKCASMVSDAWTYETVPGDIIYGALLPCREDYGYPTSLAVDADGHPNIAYYTVDGNLGYAVKVAGGGWSFEIADGIGNAGAQCSIVLDAQGNPHICYLENVNNVFRVRYAAKVSGVWSTTIINEGSTAHSCAHYTDLALDADGIPHIAFYTNNAYLGYLTKATGSDWSFEVVDNSANVGLYASIITDSERNPHISYYDYTNHVLMCATKSGSDWVTKVADDKRGTGMYSSIAKCYR